MIFLLTPQNPGHADWALSRYREPVQIIAESENDARTSAAQRFAQSKGGQSTLDPMSGPWMNPELVVASTIDQLDDRLLTLSARPARHS